MKKEKVKEMLPILQAWVDGKEIEKKLIGNNTIWKECDLNAVDEDDMYLYEFRIKSKPIYLPFNDDFECIEEMGKHFPNGYVLSVTEHQFYKIDSTYSKGICIDNNSYSFECAIKKIKFVDGEPFGKIKEEIAWG